MQKRRKWQVCCLWFIFLFDVLCCKHSSIYFFPQPTHYCLLSLLHDWYVLFLTKISCKNVCDFLLRLIIIILTYIIIIIITIVTIARRSSGRHIYASANAEHFCRSMVEKRFIEMLKSEKLSWIQIQSIPKFNHLSLTQAQPFHIIFFKFVNNFLIYPVHRQL